MRLSPLLCAGLFFVCAAAAAADQTATPARRGSFHKTTDNIHLEMVFNNHVSDPDDESGIVDMVWGSNWASLPPDVYNSAYIAFSVDDFQNDVTWYEANHQDWLEYQCDRVSLAYVPGSDRAPLDFANPAVVAYQWANWIDAKLSAGYQGIAVDLLHLTNDQARCGHFDSQHNWVAQYSGQLHDKHYRRDVLAWERAAHRHVHAQSPTATMQINATYDPTESQDDNRKLMTTTDLLFDECGFTRCGDKQNVTSPDEWLSIEASLLYVQSQGICYTTNGEEPEHSSNITQAERLWVIGNYLLFKDNCAYMYMTGRQEYGDLVTFPEYAIAIGHSSHAMVEQSGIWERRYSNGLTLVNPNDATATIDLPPGDWVDVDGNPAGPQVTLTKQTAQVLLKAP